MNWFAIGAGAALVIVGLTGFAKKPDGSPRLAPAAAIALALVGLVFLYLGGAAAVIGLSGE